MARVNDVLDFIDKVSKYDIIENNTTILNQFKESRKIVTTIINDVSLIFQTYFNDVDNGVDGLHRALGDAFSEFLSEYDIYTKVQPIILNNIDKDLDLKIDIDSLLKITDRYKKEYDNGEYQDTLVPTEPGESYSSYDQFWAYNSNESSYIKSVTVPLKNSLNGMSDIVRGVVSDINTWLSLGELVATTCSAATSFINYKFGVSNGLKYNRYELYDKKIKHILKYSTSTYNNFMLAKSIINKHPNFKHTYEFSDVLIDDVFGDTSLDQDIQNTTLRIENFFNTYFK